VIYNLLQASGRGVHGGCRREKEGNGRPSRTREYFILFFQARHCEELRKRDSQPKVFRACSCLEPTASTHSTIRREGALGFFFSDQPNTTGFYAVSVGQVSTIDTRSSEIENQQQVTGYRRGGEKRSRTRLVILLREWNTQCSIKHYKCLRARSEGTKPPGEPRPRSRVPLACTVAHAARDGRHFSAFTLTPFRDPGSL
jgi:hypothetical protein